MALVLYMEPAVLEALEESVAQVILLSPKAQAQALVVEPVVLELVLAPAVVDQAM